MTLTDRPSQRGESVGTFRVTFSFLTRPYGKPLEDEYTTPIGLIGPVYEPRDGGVVVLIEDQPKVSNKRPYEGPLSQYEVGWLLSVPGTEFNMCYRFTVEPLDDAATELLKEYT